ncbi:MAG: response regulator [Candidatus Promineifilaceae bacterium]
MSQSPLILIVDDDVTARQTVEMLLLRQGYDLQFATNGAEALTCLETLAPDVILLDVMMPGMDGFAVCQQIKTHQQWQHIPIVLLTALDGKEDMVRGLDAGADDFIHKPVSGPELRARVRSMLRIKQRHDELQTTLQLREDLANMIMHDIRNPLTTLNVYCDLLAPAVSPAGNEAFQAITAQVNRLSSFVTDLLLMAKMEHGKLVLQRTPVDVNATVRLVYENYWPLAQQRDIRLVLELPEQPPVVMLDAPLWQRVLDNLVANALKFSPTGGQVLLQITRPQSDHLHLNLHDEGPGVPPEYRETIFNKFQIVATGRRDVQQMGLGLAFCRMVVEAHRGRVYVTANQPQGAIFTVEI